MRIAPLLASVVLCTCTHEATVRTVPPAASGTVLVSVHVRCAWSMELDDAQVKLDGVPVPDGVPVATTDPLYTVEVAANLSVSCGLFASPRTRIRVQTAQALAATGPAVVEVYVVDDGDPTKRPASRLHTRWVLRGAAIEHEYHGITPPRCVGLPAVSRAECRVAMALESARQRKDVVEALCQYAKLQAIREARTLADAGDAKAVQTIFRLEHQALHCVGAEPGFIVGGGPGYVVGGGPSYVGDAATTEEGDCGPELPDPEPSSFGVIPGVSAP